MRYRFRDLLTTGPPIGRFFDGLVVRIELGAEQKYRGYASRHIAHLVNFFQRALEVFAITKPFLNDLISADGVFPDPERNILPVGGIVEADVKLPSPRSAKLDTGDSAPNS